jgi:tetratricopeptide (TPR) repeat protein
LSPKPVFISHSSLDNETADKLCRLLEAQGINCWIAPRNVPPGAKYGEAIVHAIEDASAMILIFSVHSNSSEQVMNEVERAVSKKKRIFPLKINDINPSTELEYFISRRHWLDASTESLEACTERLAAAIRQPEETFARSVPQQVPEGLPATRKKTIIFGIGIILALFVIFAVLFSDRIWRKPVGDIPALSRAYQALEKKDWSTAETLFQQMVTSKENLAKSEGNAGLAALAFARGDDSPALEYAGQAEMLEPQIAYSHVIRGHILFQQGKLAKAATEYRIATEKSHILPWQKAIAYNSLGRIQATQGDTQKALKSYETAINQHKDLSVAYVNKGYLLEKTGKTEDALKLYHRALQLKPDDPITKRLLQQAEKRQQIAQNKEKQAYTDKLVAELVQLHRTGKRRPPTGDDWTSTPLTLSVLDLQLQGTIAAREGEAEFILLKLVDALQTSGRIEVVGREILNSLLAELKLSATELADPQTALRVGKILAARLIATGKFARFGDEGQLSIRVYETETTRNKASVTKIVENPQQIDNVVNQLSKNLLAKLRSTYPLQARIARINAQEVILNIGVEQGMTAGVTMQVFGEEDRITLDGKVLDSLSSPVGLIEVTRVEKKVCNARVVEQTETFVKGCKVREVAQF